MKNTVFLTLYFHSGREQCVPLEFSEPVTDQLIKHFLESWEKLDNLRFPVGDAGSYVYIKCREVEFIKIDRTNPNA